MTTHVKFRASLVNQTANYVSPEIDLTPGKRGVLIKLNVTAAPGVDTVQIGPQCKQVNAPPGQEWYAIELIPGNPLYSPVRSTPGRDVVMSHPFCPTVNQSSAGRAVAANYRVVVIHSGAGAFNYEIEVEEVD